MRGSFRDGGSSMSLTGRFAVSMTHLSWCGGTVRREALVYRMEVRDLRRLAVQAVGLELGAA